jgi:predicted RNase H-like HicB family nuclease
MSREVIVRTAWSSEDGAFVATVPSMPGCSAVGETLAEAISEIAKAMEAWEEAQRAAGNIGAIDGDFADTAKNPQRRKR